MKETEIYEQNCEFINQSTEYRDEIDLLKKQLESNKTSLKDEVEMISELKNEILIIANKLPEQL